MKYLRSAAFCALAAAFVQFQIVVASTGDYRLGAGAISGAIAVLLLWTIDWKTK